MSFDTGVSSISLEATEASGQAAQASLGSGVNDDTMVPASVFNDLGQLQAQYPQLYTAIVQSIETDICNQMDDANQDLINTIKEGEDDS